MRLLNNLKWRNQLKGNFCAIRKIGRVVSASTLLVSTYACGLTERLATPPCVVPEPIGSVNTQGKLTNASKVTFDGIGAIKVGMSVAEAELAAGTRLVGSQPNPGGYSVQPQVVPKGVLFLVVFDTIARIDIGNRQITTQCGAKIGDTEARIKALYPGIEVTPHKYVEGWHYMTLIPKDSKNSNYRIVFNTDGKRVTTIRAGKLPEVGYVEGG